MGTLLFGIGMVIAMFMYAYGARYRAAIKKMTRNSREINIYGGYENPYVKNLIRTFNEEHPLSVEKLHKLPVKELENYAESTEELLKSIRIHLGQKSVWKESQKHFKSLHFVGFFIKKFMKN